MGIDMFNSLVKKGGIEKLVWSDKEVWYDSPNGVTVAKLKIVNFTWRITMIIARDWLETRHLRDLKDIKFEKGEIVFEFIDAIYGAKLGETK